MSNKIVARHRAAVEQLVVQIVDTLLYYSAFDPYWLDLPFDQPELEGRDFLKGRSVPPGALLEIAAAIDSHVTHSLRGAAGRSAA